jgi:hypothetical protein
MILWPVSRGLWHWSAYHVGWGFEPALRLNGRIQSSAHMIPRPVSQRRTKMWPQPHGPMLQCVCKGTRIVLADSGSDSNSESRRQSAVQGDSGSDSDSESRRQSAQRMSSVLTVRVRIVVAGAGGSVQTVWVRRFTGIISLFLFRLPESESETESACTIRVP